MGRARVVLLVPQRSLRPALTVIVFASHAPVCCSRQRTLLAPVQDTLAVCFLTNFLLLLLVLAFGAVCPCNHLAWLCIQEYEKVRQNAERPAARRDKH